MLGGSGSRRGPSAVRKRLSGRHQVVIGKEPDGAGVPRIRGQSCDEPPGGRLVEFFDGLEFGGALEVERERVVRRFIIVFFGGGRGGLGRDFRRRSADFRRRYASLERRFAAFCCGLEQRIGLYEGGRGVFAFDEPLRPGIGVAAGGAGVECCGMGIGAVGPRRVGGDEPALEIPEHPTGDAAEDRAGGPGRQCAPGVGQIGLLHLPVDPVTAAGAEAAEGQSGGAIGSGIRGGRFGSSTGVFVGERDVDGARPGGTADQVAGFCGDFRGEGGREAGSVLSADG